MKLQDAIQHCEDVAEHCDNKECAADHRQLAQWLKELQELREKQTLSNT